MYLGKYHIEHAIVDAAKVAYLAAVIKHNLTGIEKYNSAQPVVKTARTIPSIISKMLVGNPEAYFYWSKYAEIEDF